MPSSASQHGVAPAKINLGLSVLRRRSDGFHDIETVLLPIGWHDLLHVAPARAFRFTCSDSSLPNDERNLCVRAAHLLAAHAGVKPHGVLHLEKHIPHGAGLGGGSSDAAWALRLLASHWGLELPQEDMHALASQLGSDVPFFLHEQAMVATGRGDLLAPLAGEPYRLPHILVVVKPRVHVSSADAYALIQPNPRQNPDLRSLVLSNDLERWRAELVNDFEAPIVARYPEIAAVKGCLVRAGAQYASLSGSGSAVFGVFEDVREARAAVRQAQQAGWRTWTSAGPEVEGSAP
jgi:4-diphosphocytidyl-2-C-methyl-D-erythritol kinase